MASASAQKSFLKLTVPRCGTNNSYSGDCREGRGKNVPPNIDFLLNFPCSRGKLSIRIFLIQGLFLIGSSLRLRDENGEVSEVFAFVGLSCTLESSLEHVDRGLRISAGIFCELLPRREKGSIKSGRCFATRFREPLRSSIDGCKDKEGPFLGILKQSFSVAEYSKLIK